MRQSKVIENIKFNKSLNKFFDTKTIFLKQKKLDKINIHEKFNIQKTTKKESVSISLKIYTKEEYQKGDKIYLKPIDEIHKFLKHEKLNRYFKYFLIHGSLADKKYIKGWSDVDTFVVIKDSTVKSYKQLHHLKKKIKLLYKFFFQICPLQHHGLILFTESDLENYSNNYLPYKALSNNINLLDKKKKLLIQPLNDKNYFLFDDIKNRLQLLKDAKISGEYKHHPFKNKYLRFPIKKNREEMFQLFCHLGYMNTLPAYYFTCIGKSLNKKDSFKKFESNFKKKKIIKFLKKSEKIRFLWEKNNSSNRNFFYIPQWVVSLLGKNYLDECIEVFEEIIKEIEIHYEKK